ncbi:MAG TPA: hypothetical protein VIH21_12580 [Dehalococcoidia bacterium]
MSIATSWGATETERALPLPCDDVLAEPNAVYHRCVTVRASADTLFEWLCQLRVAPYSYDWVDNFGRRSPRERDPALRDLRAGQRVMKIFELASFDDPAHITIRLRDARLAGAFFGDIVVTYCILPERDGACRLLARVVVRYPRGPLGLIARLVLPWGDLVMMRRQLLNLCKLAERDDARAIDAVAAR